MGDQALDADTKGAKNVAVGALRDQTTGSANTALGQGAGQKLTTGSDNIEIANPGVADDGATIRLGTPGLQTRAFLAGVYGVRASGSTRTVVIRSSGQLATAPKSHPADVAGMSIDYQQLAIRLLGQVRRQQAEIDRLTHVQTRIGRLAAEVAQLRRLTNAR